MPPVLLPSTSPTRTPPSSDTGVPPGQQGPQVAAVGNEDHRAEDREDGRTGEDHGAEAGEEPTAGPCGGDPRPGKSTDDRAQRAGRRGPGQPGQGGPAGAGEQ